MRTIVTQAVELHWACGHTEGYAVADGLPPACSVCHPPPVHGAVTPPAVWRLQRVCEGAIGRNHADPDLIASIDPEAILGALAAAEVEHGKHDPADLASVIDWPVLRLRGESVDDYRDRVG